jgi:hypothetical protein
MGGRNDMESPLAAAVADLRAAREAHRMAFTNSWPSLEDVYRLNDRIVAARFAVKRAIGLPAWEIISNDDLLARAEALS